MLYFVCLFIIGYLIGSINLSILVSRYIGKYDITKVGSGNAGGTNVARTMGAKWGIGVMAAEIAKSSACGLIAMHVYPGDFLGWGKECSLLCGTVAVLGCLAGNHFPCFHHFKGGKGVTVIAALAIVVDWRLAIALTVLFLIIFLSTRIVSVSSMVASLGIPIYTLIVHISKPYGIYPFIVTAIIYVCVVFNHRQNIVRLFKGKENRFEFGKREKK